MKQQLIAAIAEQLTSYGFEVYLSDDKKHGFYTDGKRVVSFGGQWNFSVDFSGNYAASKYSGTGWAIANERTGITQEEAQLYITANAPHWANQSPIYTTPAQHLKTYGASSGYELFTAA